MNTPYSGIDYLADHADPSDLKIITETLKQLDNDPSLGFEIFFKLPELKNCCVYWTPDKKWRILFRKERASDASRNRLLKITQETKA